MNPKEPKHFSDHFNIDKAKLNELGVFDAILNFDTKVFVEPLLLKESSSEIIKNSYHNSYKQFFSVLLLLLQKSQTQDDKCWRTAKRMVNFPEYQYTCIGYSSGNTDGRGSGVEFNDKILQSAKEIVASAEGNPEIFLLLPLLEEGIAGDRISDMAQNIIDEDICQYTQDIMTKIGLKGSFNHINRNKKSYTLPLNPYSKTPIKLIPKDILLNLPVADNIDSLVEEMAAYNTRLRDIVNTDIGYIWHDTTKSQRKEMLLKELKTNKEFFIETLKALKEYKFEHYDLKKDYEGLYKWLENSQDFINIELSKETKNCPDNIESLSFAVTAIIHHFRDTIENHEMWRTFWTKHNSEDRHVKAYYSQMLFFTVCSTWLNSQDSNIKINLTHNAKNINLEFTVSGKHRLIIHVKHDNNPNLEKSYKAILEEYRNLNDIKHCYLIMNFQLKLPKQLTEIKIIENPICKILEIDVTKKDLAETEATPDIYSDFLEFEDMKDTDNRYTQEKRKGGKSSYQDYKPLRDKVEELCLQELNSKQYPSANQLCNQVASIIEKDYPQLLDTFPPYQKGRIDGIEWTKPSVYNWCKSHYKTFKNSTQTK